MHRDRYGEHFYFWILIDKSSQVKGAVVAWIKENSIVWWRENFVFMVN